MTPAKARILVVDDEESSTSYIRDVLSKVGYAVLTASGGKDAVALIERERIHLALVDMVMPDLSGLEVLKKIKERSPESLVIIMTAYADVETAVEAMKQGALHYLIKPFTIAELKMHVERALSEIALSQENRWLKREKEQRKDSLAMIGNSPAITSVREMMQKVADSDSTILIQGETGTGKEVVARIIHRESSRREGPFLAINCGAIPETLLEHELFGHERGAFTGAEGSRPGLLEAAAEGTLFLDEIVEMPPSIQVKFLRVLDGHEFLRLGGTRPIKCQTRFIAATNQDLEKAVSEKKLREDLYFRLNVVTITLPPLRERGGDIVQLAEHFIKTNSIEKQNRVTEFSKEVKQSFLRYGWPGNVRELKNVIERAILLCGGGQLTSSDVKLDALIKRDKARHTNWKHLKYQQAKKVFEKDFLTQALARNAGNVSKAAKAIGLNRQNLYQKLRQLKIKYSK